MSEHMRDTDQQQPEAVSRRALLATGAAIVAGIGGGAVVIRSSLVTAQDDATPDDSVATPDASPSPEGSPSPTAGELTVEMHDIFFDPKELTIEADTDVTIALPNEGAAVHNFNIDSNNNPEDPEIHSGDVAPGDSTTVTVNLAAGEWYFYCDIPGHEAAGMHGTITAE